MHYFAISLKSSLLYRKGVFISFLGAFVFIAVNLALWRALLWDDPAAHDYMTRYTIIANVMAMLYPRKIAESIGTKIATGEFAETIAKPVNFFAMAWEVELAGVCSRFVLRGVPLVLVFLPFLLSGAYFNVPFFLLSVFMACVLSMLLYSLIGFGVFIVADVWPLRRILDDTIRLLAGSFVPLALFPQPIGSVAYALPFRFLYSFPLETLLGTADRASIASGYVTMCLWIALFAAANILICRLAFKRTALQW
ncbi:MAG: ABC-2 family transporter protein [Synergistaceae bacterium]|jgi:ABC-2 type transport system permease protein|nr:ABC-2 family transporter protein [Synergistaceae bacterium]